MKVIWDIDEPVLRPRQHHDRLHDDTSMGGHLLFNLGPPRTPNLIFLISSVTVPIIPTPFAQILFARFHTLLHLRPQHQLRTLEVLSRVALELLTFLSHPSLVVIHPHPRHLLHPLLVAQPIVICSDGKPPPNSMLPSLLRSLCHLLRPSSHPNPLVLGLDMVFPQIPRQELRVLRVPIVHSRLSPMFLIEYLLDRPSQRLPMDGTYLCRETKAVPLLQNLLNAPLVLPTLMPKAFNPRLKLHSLP